MIGKTVVGNGDETVGEHSVFIDVVVDVCMPLFLQESAPLYLSAHEVTVGNLPVDACIGVQHLDVAVGLEVALFMEDVLTVGGLL